MHTMQKITKSVDTPASMNKAYADFSVSPIDYKILVSPAEVRTAVQDPRNWRIVEFKDAMVEMLRVPVQVKNDVLPIIEQETGLRITTKKELAAAFTTRTGHQFSYPWGDRADARNAPILLKENPNGMGMNMAGLYFNGPDNPQDPRKNGLWMVTAERQGKNYTHGYRSGTAGNVGVFSKPVETSSDQNLITISPGQRGVLPGTRGELCGGSRGVLPGARGELDAGHRGVLPGERGELSAGNRGSLPHPSVTANRLTPAGIGYGEELRQNEGYLLVRPLTTEKRETYKKIKQVLGNKLDADDGIPLISIGAIPSKGHEVIMFGAVGHCLTCPNIVSITTPLNARNIADKTGKAVVEYREFEHHRVQGSEPIVPVGVDMKTAGRRVYFPQLKAG